MSEVPDLLLRQGVENAVIAGSSCTPHELMDYFEDRGEELPVKGGKTCHLLTIHQEGPKEKLYSVLRKGFEHDSIFMAKNVSGAVNAAQRGEKTGADFVSVDLSHVAGMFYRSKAKMAAVCMMTPPDRDDIFQSLNRT